LIAKHLHTLDPWGSSKSFDETGPKFVFLANAKRNSTALLSSFNATRPLKVVMDLLANWRRQDGWQA